MAREIPAAVPKVVLIGPGTSGLVEAVAGRIAARGFAVERADEGMDADVPPWAAAAAAAALAVIVPGVGHAVRLGRQLLRAHPGIQVMIAGERADLVRLRAAAAYGAHGGSPWRVVAADPEEIAAAAGEILAAGARRRRLRTTLDRINLQLGESQLAATDYRRLRISDHYLATILRDAEDAIISLDLAGVVVSWNAGAERLLRLAESEARGRPLASLARWSGDVGAMVAATVRGEAARHELEASRDDWRVQVDAHFTAVRDDSGGVMAVAGILRDITERRRIERERTQLLAAERAARSEAERANLLKDEFLSVLSHELRTPLTAIIGYVHVLRMKGGLPDDVLKALQVIERNATAQGQIVNDLLDMSSIASGKLRLELSRVEPAHLVDAAVESVQPALRAKEVRVRTILDTGLPPLLADPNRLQQVLWNLLSNAAKFSRKGGTVTVTLVRAESRVEFAVSDDGEGISPDFLPHVFDRFRQQDASTTRRHGGLGLGLSIVKQLVELHGGQIRAASAGLGKGATFTVALPVTAVQAAASGAEARAPAAPADIAPPRLEPWRILVVDDEPDARAMLVRLLEAYGASVASAEAGDEAIRKLEAGGYDLLISDIGMPRMDGYELIRRVRGSSAETVRRIPAVALTAFARSEDRRRALMAGYHMHVGKPVDPAELVTVVSSLVARPVT